MRMLSAVCLAVVCCLLSLPLASFADRVAAMEKVKHLGVSVEGTLDGGGFTVSKESNDEALGNAFLKQKAEFDYVITLSALNSSYVESDTIATYRLSGVIPAGQRSVTINVDKYASELKPKLISTGTIDFQIYTAAGVDYYTAGGGNSLSVANDDYRQKMTDTATNNPDLLNSFATDYQNFMLAHHDLPPEQINREFIRKYPQYKDMLPQ
jgi:hypothetical protein